MRLDSDGLLRSLHEGVFHQPLWSDFLERLRHSSGALYASLVFRNVNEDDVTELYAGPETPPQLDRLFVEKFERDPLPYRRMREGRVYTFEELIEAGGPQLSAYRDEFLYPLGIRSIRGVRVTEPGGVDAWLGCAGDTTIGSPTGSLLNALAPHLRIALRTFMTLERERVRSAMTSETFRRMNFGWIALDEQCRVLDASPHIEQLLQRTRLLRRGRYDRLISASAKVDLELGALVRLFASDDTARPKAINLSRDPWIDILVSPPPDRSMRANAKPAAILYVSGDRSTQAGRHEQLIDLFDLSPSEARLAWSMVQGMSIAEAASELRLTIETARNYTKKIYLKTGSRGQTDLVRHILTSVLALA